MSTSSSRTEPRAQAQPAAGRQQAGPGGRSPRRRTQVERSETMQRRLVEATARLLRARGYGGLRTSEVSELAGVSRGAQLHHFPSKNALVIATMRYLNEQMLERARQRSDAARAAADPLDALIEDAFDFFFGDYFFIALAIGMSDERNHELRAGVEPYMVPGRLEIERQWLAVLVSAGYPRPLAADLLSLTLSLVRGYAVRTLLVPAPVDRFAAQMAAWKRLVGQALRKATPPRRPDARQA